MHFKIKNNNFLLTDFLEHIIKYVYWQNKPTSQNMSLMTPGGLA